VRPRAEKLNRLRKVIKKPKPPKSIIWMSRIAKLKKEFSLNVKLKFSKNELRSLLTDQIILLKCFYNVSLPNLHFNPFFYCFHQDLINGVIFFNITVNALYCIHLNASCKMSLEKSFIEYWKINFATCFSLSVLLFLN